MTSYRKKDFPVSNVRRFLEPGPIVLVSSSWKGQNNIMTMGWHMIMEFEPSLIGCYIWEENQSFNLIRKSKECVINVPTVEIANQVVKIGNCSGRDVDKFEKFNLTPLPGKKVDAPAIKECYTQMNSKFGNLARKPRKFLRLEQATIAEWQGASEDQKFAAKLTQSKTKF